MGVKFKIRLDSIEQFENFVTDSLATEVGQTIVDESKKSIASGLSPVKGVGRFEAYKHPEKYPGNKKPARPVNLYLTGAMLSYLNFYRRGNSIWVGIVGAPQKINTIARVHNTGERSDIPQRQFVPEDGQEYIASIMVKVRQLFRKRVLEIIEYSKK